MKFSMRQNAVFEAFKKPRARVAVNACPGSGKTTTLVGTVNECVEPMDFYDTMATCFNVDIRDVMIQKFPAGTNVSNIHKIGKSVCDKHLLNGRRAGRDWVNQYKYRNIIDEIGFERGWDKSEDMGKFIAAEKAVAMAQLTLCDVPDIAAFSGMCADYDVSVNGDIYEIQSVVKEALIEGVRVAKKGVCIDFNDMIYLPTALNMQIPTYSNVLIDEGQDLNAAQSELILGLCREDSRILLVGDPRQSIYGFAGAAQDAFHNVKNRIEGLELPLDICYRCGSDIVAYADQFYPGTMVAADNAHKGIVDSISYKDVAAKVSAKRGDIILSRVTAPLVALAFELISQRIPAKIKGRDVMASITGLAKLALKGKKPWGELTLHLDAYVMSESMRLRAHPNPATEAKIANLQDRAESLEILFNAALCDNVNSLESFGKWIYQFFDEKITGCVTLSTVHKSKGTEADTVFILDPSNMPHPMAKTENQRAQETNIQWVAFTRAINQEFLVSPKPRN